MEYPEKQTKKRSPAGIIFPVILLLILGSLGYVIYSITKAPLKLDDPAKLAVAAPMPATERFRFSAGEKTAQVKLDTRDLWSMLLDTAGENFMEEINEIVSDAGLSVTGCGIQITQEGMQINLEVYYKTIRLAVKMPCELEIDGTDYYISIPGAKLGVVPLPNVYPLGPAKAQLEFVLPVLDQVTDIAYAEDTILITGPLGQDLYTLIPEGKSLYAAALFRPELSALADALETEKGFASLLEMWEQDPAGLEETYGQLFLQADPKILEEYLADRNGLTQRFFPGIDFHLLDLKREEQNQQLGESISDLEQFFTKLVNDYNEKNFLLKQGTFFHHGNAFRAESYGAGQFDSLFTQLDPESFYPVLVNAEDGFIRKTSSFNRIAEEGLEFTREVDYNRTYILGCVLRSVAGEPYLMYESEIRGNNTYSRVIKLVPLTEEEVSELQQEGKFGVWVG